MPHVKQNASSAVSQNPYFIEYVIIMMIAVMVVVVVVVVVVCKNCIQ